MRVLMQCSAYRLVSLTRRGELDTSTIPAQNEVNGKQLFAALSAVADYDYPSIADLYSSTIKHVSIVDRGSIQLHDNMAYGETMLLTRPVPQN